MINKEHFKKAANNIARFGDNDTLPFDIENNFISNNIDGLVDLCYNFFSKQENSYQAHRAQNSNSNKKIKGNKPQIKDLTIFNERLLVPVGSAGFRIVTKLHPFWSIYFNGLSICIAEKIESSREDAVFSYRYNPTNEDELFKKEFNWQEYCKATIKDIKEDDELIIVKTDISSFYERISHHFIENDVNEIFPNTTMSKQVNDILSKISSGRSFGLPVGGQAARILAEMFMHNIDHALSAKGVRWYRYVDDFTLIGSNYVEAYEILSRLSKILANYGLSLNRTKTTIFSAKHYIKYIETQLEPTCDEQKKLVQINLHFDPYSDNPEADYEKLKQDANDIKVIHLLNLELQKSQPDRFIMAQISKILDYLNDSGQVANCLKILLDKRNINSFRASFPKILKAVVKVRNNSKHKKIFPIIDELLDDIIDNSRHLLQLEGNCLFFLKSLQFSKNSARTRYIENLYNTSDSYTVKKECICCWQKWGDRNKFNEIKNMWETLDTTQKRILWLVANKFGDAGICFTRQNIDSFYEACKIGVENQNTISFPKVYNDWCKNESNNQS